jgi:signal transduction histidine kinase
MTDSRQGQHADQAHRGWVRRHPKLIDLGFGVLIAALIVAMVLWEDFETVPYHLAFVALAAMYGFRIWSLRVTALVLVIITSTTGLILIDRYLSGEVEVEELSEIPLMPMILIAMAWHARRRQAMQREVQAYADGERARWLREQEFLRDCSHALRTPLTVARGHVELIRDFRDPREFDSDIAIVLGELDHLNCLASRLLAIADVERPQALRRQPMDAAQLIRDATTRWSGSTNRHWVCDVEGELWVLADAERLATALDALIENAVKATDPGGTIRIVGRRTGTCVSLAVADDGPGIAAEDSEAVFERFWKRPSRRGERGTGLGLAYAKSVALAHGGTATIGRAAEGGALVGLSLVSQEPPQSRPDSGQVVAAGAS